MSPPYARPEARRQPPELVLVRLDGDREVGVRGSTIAGDAGPASGRGGAEGPAPSRRTSGKDSSGRRPRPPGRESAPVPAWPKGQLAQARGCDHRGLGVGPVLIVRDGPDPKVPVRRGWPGSRQDRSARVLRMTHEMSDFHWASSATQAGRRPPQEGRGGSRSWEALDGRAGGALARIVDSGNGHPPDRPACRRSPARALLENRDRGRVSATPTGQVDKGARPRRRRAAPARPLGRYGRESGSAGGAGIPAAAGRQSTKLTMTSRRRTWRGSPRSRAYCRWTPPTWGDMAP